MYFPDLTPYEYIKESTSKVVLNVGWLAAGHSYERGVISSHLKDRLRTLATSVVNLTRGFHDCEFCPSAETISDDRGMVFYESGNIHRGNGEIRLCGPDGCTFAAPVLILHYVEAHGYKPPEEFLRALEMLPISE